MMKRLSVSAVLALALAGAAHALPQESTTEEEGFNLFSAEETTDAASEGWNFGESDGSAGDGFMLPDGSVEDRLGDIAEIPTEEIGTEAPIDLPEISEPEDDLIRIN